MRLLYPLMVVVSTPSRRFIFASSERFLSMRFCSGAECPGRGQQHVRGKRHDKRDGKAFFMAAFPGVMQGFSCRKAGGKIAAESGLRATFREPATAPSRPARVPFMARQRAIFPRDTGLQVRMLSTLFLLGLLYVAFVVVLFAVGASAVTMVVVIGAITAAQLFFSDKLALHAMGAKEVSPAEAPGLHSMIERLCIQADLPKPRVAVADSDVPNACAMGRSQKNATVCATTAIMRTLSPAELEGVMAHELTHVKNRDVMIMTIASFFASVAAMMMQFGFFFGGGDDEDGGLPFIVVLLASFVVYIVSFFLMLALSRYREFSADRGAALITGRPSALASALAHLSGAMETVPTQDLREAQRMNAFFIVPASVKATVQPLFSPPPPMEKRIERLQQMEAQLQQQGAYAAA